MFGGLDVSTAELVLCCVAAAVGAVVQGAVGFGYALVLVPALLLLAPSAVPVTPLAVAAPLVLVQAFAERSALDRGGFARMTAGRIPGTAIGAWVLTVASADFLAGAVGALLLIAVLAGIARGARRTSPRLEVAAGFASGVAGTVGAVGGPYMGLAFADRPGPVLRATVSMAFCVAVFVSLAAIAIAGELERGPLVLALALVPVTLAGLLLGRPVVGRLDAGRLKPAVYVFAGAAGLFALLRALV